MKYASVVQKKHFCRYRRNRNKRRHLGGIVKQRRVRRRQQGSGKWDGRWWPREFCSHFVQLGVPGLDPGRVEVFVQKSGSPEHVGIKVNPPIDGLKKKKQNFYTEVDEH